MVAGAQSGHSKKSNRSIDVSGRSGSKSNSSSNGMSKAGGGGAHCDTESDTSISPSTEFSNMPTYRVPCKSSRGGDGRMGVGK